MAKITRVQAREVLYSRGRPTVEVDIVVDHSVLGRAIVPSGASTGTAEALELRDKDRQRFGGRGVLRAVKHVNEILASVVMGRDPFDQAGVDRAMIDDDGTPNKSRLGANAILGVSLATARAAAAALNQPLYRYLGGVGAHEVPVPMVNMISGGRHSENSLDMQDFLVICAGARTYSESLMQTAAIYEQLGKVLKREGRFVPGVADEGGYGPALERHEEALIFLATAIREAGLKPGEDVYIAIDVAATEFCESGTYNLAAESRKLDAQGMVALLGEWCDAYPILSIEDGVAENDESGWQALTQALGGRVQLIGDDLFTTNPSLLARGIAKGLANSVLVKVNQIGTLSETLQVVDMARDAGYLPVISARSGESEDPFIADLAVATGAGQIKIGAITRSERTAKYNQLLRIEEELGAAAVFHGKSVFKRFLDARR